MRCQLSRASLTARVGWRGRFLWGRGRVCCARVDDPETSVRTWMRAGQDCAPHPISWAHLAHATWRPRRHPRDPPPSPDPLRRLPPTCPGLGPGPPRGTRSEKKRAKARSRAARIGARPTLRALSSQTSLPGRPCLHQQRLPKFSRETHCRFPPAGPRAPGGCGTSPNLGQVPRKSSAPSSAHAGLGGRRGRPPLWPRPRGKRN